MNKDFICDRCEQRFGIDEIACITSIKDSCDTQNLITLCESCVFPELEELTKQMDVPEIRRVDARWLYRNLEIKNDQHELFPKAIMLVKVAMNM